MKIPCTYMRGGTSKGCMFLKSDLPLERGDWDDLFIKVMGGPDPKQIDGMGGTVSSNNKILIVSPSEKEGIDVEYLVAQVLVGKPRVDYSANCGNMTAAVGPFAIRKGLIAVSGNCTKVRMLNLNTNKVIEERVPCENGAVQEEGDCAISGIAGTGAELEITFLNPAGSKTGKLLPTESSIDPIAVSGMGTVEVSIIDITNVFVFVRSRDLGLQGTELPVEINSNPKLLETLEEIRGKVAEKIHLVENWKDAASKSGGSPKLVILSEPKDYLDIEGNAVAREEMDVCVRVISMGMSHKALPLTGATAIGGAAFLPSCLMEAYLKGAGLSDTVRIGHPSGIMTVRAEYDMEGGVPQYRGIASQRTARVIMEGVLYIKE